MPVAPVMGQEAEDLYFYQLGDISLGKDQRGYYPLFSAQVPYEHLYTWDIPDYIDVHERYRPEPDRAPEVVWHVLKLTNTTDQPWTTAPAMTTQDGRVLGQDTIHYTPATGRTELRITQAISIHAEENEYEITRKRNAARFYGSDYDLVTVRGELAVTNYKSQAVRVKITKTLTGQATEEVDGEPEIAKLARGLRRVNPRSQLIWHVDVKPGQDNTVTLHYTYEVYVRG